MNRCFACLLTGLLLFAGCASHDDAMEDPGVKSAPPLKLGVHSLAPKSPAEESSNATNPDVVNVPAADLPRAPDIYRVKFDTTKGNFVVEVYREWAPIAADRFHELVTAKYYDNMKFFRAVEGFMVQFGISGDPKLNDVWRERRIPDDPVVHSNTRGRITFATSGPHARTTQLFINYCDNSRLDGMGFSPFGKVVEGMDVVDSLNKEYDEEPSRYQQQIQEQGNAFLEKSFPRLDGIRTARIVEELPADTPADATKVVPADPPKDAE